MPVLKPYADQPARRSLQVAADVAVVIGLLLAVRGAFAVHGLVEGLATPGRRLEEAAAGLAESLGSAGSSVADVPLVGDALRGPLDAASSAAAQLGAVGRSQQEVVDRLAVVLAVLTVAVPLLLALIGWLLPRLRFARRAGAARTFVRSGADLELFALRALVHQPLPALARVSSDPVAAWRAGDVRVVRGLAELELDRVGVRGPQRELRPDRPALP